ncbi:hypothetical protein [Curtobacterium sp. S6]|uniref:hypothetical protein n=1 Tax=Curtobacterium sp. S6 TaxID=1479623 RepID=UPI00128F8BC8|nr:hypothetical protein [Curtobacterium sp. S6]
MEHAKMVKTELTRRSVARGAMWSVPVVCASSAVPAIAASRSVQQTLPGAGLYVTASKTDGGIGYGPDDGTTNTADSSLNWNPATGKPTNCQRFAHGEGIFTPGSNSTSGADGSYGSTSGFWWATPQDDAGNFIKGATAQLNAGAKFVTTVKLTVPAGANASWTLSNVTINRKKWGQGGLSGPLVRLPGARNALAFGGVKGTWTASAPSVTPGANGDMVFTGTITFQTTENALVRDNGKQHYGQAVIMPGTVFFQTAYGWNQFTLTSTVENATIVTTVPGGYTNPYPASKPLVLTKTLTTTTFIVPC